jgi:hypothetical protein
MPRYTANELLYLPNREDTEEVDVTLSENFTKIDTKFGQVDTKLAELESRPVSEGGGTSDIDGGNFLDAFEEATELDGGEF